MSSNNDYVNLSNVPKDKRDHLRNLLFSFTDKQKNFNRLDTIVASECSKYCLSNFKTDKLNTEENICLSNCFVKYYDALDLGETIYDKMSKREVDLSPLSEGKFSDVIDKI
jgi:hypothetical protein